MALSSKRGAGKWLADTFAHQQSLTRRLKFNTLVNNRRLSGAERVELDARIPMSNWLRNSGDQLKRRKAAEVALLCIAEERRP